MGEGSSRRQGQRGSSICGIPGENGKIHLRKTKKKTKDVERRGIKGRKWKVKNNGRQVTRTHRSGGKPKRRKANEKRANVTSVKMFGMDIIIRFVKLMVKMMNQ